MDDELIAQSCARDPLLRFLQGLLQIEGIRRLLQGDSPASDLVARLHQVSEKDSPGPIQSLMKNPNEEALLKSLVYVRVSRLAKLICLESQLAGNGKPLQPSALEWEQRSSDLELQKKNSLSSFDPFKKKQDPRLVLVKEITEDLIFFSPAKKKSDGKGFRFATSSS